MGRVRPVSASRVAVTSGLPASQTPGGTAREGTPALLPAFSFTLLSGSAAPS